MKNNKNINAILSWKYDDYLSSNVDYPQRIEENPGKTEGEMMTDEELASWVSDSIKTLEIMKEEDENTFKKIHKGFLADLEYLIELGRIEKDTLEHFSDQENLDIDKEDT